MLSTRTGTILRSIVEQYVAGAVPVSSQGVFSNCQLGVSPATIRNEMAFLEEEGYVTRPHSSAGSMPSDKGYRYYVEALDKIELPLPEQRLISHLFYQVESELEEWLSLAATLIAQLAQNMVVVTVPKAVECQFKYLELVTLRDSLALGVVVLCGGRVRQQLITFDRVMSQPQLTAIASKLNTTYSGLTSSQIVAKGLELSPAEKQLTELLLNIMRAEDELGHEEPRLDGLRFMVNQPEFTNTGRMAALMELVEHRKLVKTIVSERVVRHGVQVTIGKENEAEVIRNCSVVISRYGLPGEAAGIIGVIGPTRMPYGRTISAVGYLSSVLSRLVAELYGKETPTN